MLPDSKCPDEEVILLDIGGHRGQAGGSHKLVICKSRTRHLESSKISEEKGIEQR